MPAHPNLLLDTSRLRRLGQLMLASCDKPLALALVKTETLQLTPLRPVKVSQRCRRSSVEQSMAAAGLTLV